MGLAPGETFGRYTIEASIGAGGMGIVLVAHDNVLDRKVALKIIRPDRQDKEEACARFFREARLAARLTHPNTIRVYDLGEIEETPFIAMEYVEGQPLTVFAGHREVPIERRVGWMLGIARGLEAAHAIGLVHRDVKLANMMVSTDDVAKILDFGLAKRRETSPRLRATFQTQIGFVVGTPMYMAPEQIEGTGADERSDQFSWGLAAYLLLSGRNPRAIDPLLLGPITPLDAIVVGMPPAVSAVIAKTMQRSREHRFGSMTQVVAALDAAMRTKAAVAPTTVPIRRTSGRPFYCPGCATQLDENRRCPRCGFIAKKIEPEAKPPAPSPEPPKIAAWKLVRSEDRAPFAPLVAAIARDGARAIVFRGSSAARREPPAWGTFQLRTNVDVRCAVYDFDGSVIVGGKNGFCGRLMLDGTFTQWPLVTSAMLSACTTSGTGRVTFVGTNIVAHVEGANATAFACDAVLTNVARLGDTLYAVGEGSLYGIAQSSIEKVTLIDIGRVRTMVTRGDDLFLAGGEAGFVWRMDTDRRLAKEPIDDKDVSLVLLAASASGVWGVTESGLLYRREEGRWARFAGLEEHEPLLALRMIGEQLVGLTKEGAIVTSELVEPRVSRNTQPLAPVVASPGWKIERAREPTSLAPFRIAAISSDGRTAAAIGANKLAVHRGAWSELDASNIDLAAIRALAVDAAGGVILAGARGFAIGIATDGTRQRFIVGHSRAALTTFVAIAMTPDAILLGGVVERGGGLFVRAHDDGSTSALEMASPVVSIAITASGKVYVACGDGFIGYVDDVDVRLAVKLGTRVRHLVAAGDDLIAVGNDGGILFVGQDGHARRETSEAEEPIVALAARSGIVFAATARGHVVRRDPAEATPVWRRLSPIDAAPYAILALHAEEHRFLAIEDDGSRTTGTP